MRALKNIFLFFGGLLLLNGCYYDINHLEPLDTIGEVNFQADVIPILNESCNTTGCHSIGDNVPDLSAANAFDALFEGGYIATANPELSILYRRINGTTAGPIMPPGGRLSSKKIQTVLKWINDGATTE